MGNIVAVMENGMAVEPFDFYESPKDQGLKFRCPTCHGSLMWVQPKKRKAYFKHFPGLAAACPDSLVMVLDTSDHKMLEELTKTKKVFEMTPRQYANFKDSSLAAKWAESRLKFLWKIR